MSSKRVQVILTDDMVNGLKDAARERNMNLSALVRLVAAEWLKENEDILVDHRLAWGGLRNEIPAQTSSGGTAR